MRTDLYNHSDDFLMAADDFIAKYISDRRLRSVVAYMNPLYGGRGGRTPAYVHALISVLYINGASRFVGGSSHFADLLADVIREHGGEVVAGDAVTWVEVNNRRVAYVKTAKGSQYEADWYISDIHPCTLLKLMDESAFPKAFRRRMEEIPNSYSAFSLYIKMKKGSFPYINHSEYFTRRYDEIWNFCSDGSSWPMGFLLMTPPEENQGPWSDKVLVTAPMQFDMVRRWENTTVGRRGEDYEQWKQQRTDELLALVEELHPGFREAIEAVNASSPLTIRDFYGVKEGAICGFSKDCNNITLSQLPVVTKVSNLLLTGQNNNLHGFCGVPLTAINTCEAILGLNKIIEKL
jgi:all-trans-retinol 13,14-reductase